jgi:hypothetical protein
MVRAPDPRLLEFLSAYDRHISELALMVREVVLEEAPEAVESIYDAYSAVAIGFSFTGRLKDGFCHVATYSGYVNLGFNRGVLIADPHKVLVGTGKWTRHIRIAAESDLRRPFLRRYIQDAIELVGGPKKAAAGVSKSVVRGNYPNKRRPKRK